MLVNVEGFPCTQQIDNIYIEQIHYCMDLGDDLWPPPTFPHENETKKNIIIAQWHQLLPFFWERSFCFWSFPETSRPSLSALLSLSLSLSVSVVPSDALQNRKPEFSSVHLKMLYTNRRTQMTDILYLCHYWPCPLCIGVLPNHQEFHYM